MADKNSQQLRNLTAEAIISRAQGGNTPAETSKDATSAMATTLSQSLSPEAYRKLAANLLTANLGQLKRD